MSRRRGVAPGDTPAVSDRGARADAVSFVFVSAWPNEPGARTVRVALCLLL